MKKLYFEQNLGCADCGNCTSCGKEEKTESGRVAQTSAPAPQPASFVPPSTDEIPYLTTAAAFTPATLVEAQPALDLVDDDDDDVEQEIIERKATIVAQQASQPIKRIEPVKCDSDHLGWLVATVAFAGMVAAAVASDD